MRRHFPTLCLVLLQPMPALLARDPGLVSGPARLDLRETSPGNHVLSFGFAGRTMDTTSPGKSVSLEVNGTPLEAPYSSVTLANDTLTCTATLSTENGSRFLVTDRFLPETSGAFELRRVVSVEAANPADKCFNSSFGLTVDSSEDLMTREFFVPGIWYKTNFRTKMNGVLATNPADRSFLFREDRLPLPLVTHRDPSTGITVSLLHAMSDPQTFAGDTGTDRIVDERMQFGSLGVRRQGGTSLSFLYPGSEGERNHVSRSNRDSWALRSHPVKQGVRHHYKLVIRFSQTTDYPQAVAESWRHAFSIYQPVVRPADIRKARVGLIDTLDHYFVGKMDGYDAPGFPFSVYLPKGDIRAYNYQMGFIGRQTSNAWFLIQEGISTKQAGLRAKGVEILDFWANNCLLPSGLPRTWYDPAKAPSSKGSWRKNDNPKGGAAMRVATTGMEGMLRAWQAEKAAGAAKPGWLDACRKFGDWLVTAQNEDGSYYLAYSHELQDGKHPPTESSKATTINPIRFLSTLHTATGDPRYLSLIHI